MKYIMQYLKNSAKQSNNCVRSTGEANSEATTNCVRSTGEANSEATTKRSEAEQERSG